MRKIVQSVFTFRCSLSFVTRFFLSLELYSILLPYFYCYFFFAKKTMLSFQMLLKGTFSLLTCHLLFSITARVSMHDTKTSTSAKTFRPQSSPYFLCKPRTRNSRTNGVKQTEWSFPLVWSKEGAGRLGGEAKNTSKKIRLSNIFI